MDVMTDQFVHESSNFGNLFAMGLGSCVFRSAQVAFSSAGAGQVLANLGALSFEVSAYQVSTQFMIQCQGGQVQENFWSLQNWSSHYLSFGILKGSAVFIQTQSAVMAHVFQDSAVVVSQNLAYQLGLTFQPLVSIAEQILQAELTNIAMQAGSSLFRINSVPVWQTKLSQDKGLFFARSEKANLPLLAAESSTSSSRSDDVFFGRSQAYSDVVLRNTSTHREAVAEAVQVFGEWQNSRGVKSLRFLDLACGDSPVVPYALAKRFSELEFLYEGVDISPLQIKRAKHFEAPLNMRERNLREGDAWDLRPLEGQKFDVIYTGLNLHHGTPEELAFTLEGMKAILKPDGLLMIHDVFRPERLVGQPLAYLRRPDFLKEASLRMVREDLISQEHRRRALEVVRSEEKAAFDWRLGFMRDYEANMERVAMTGAAQAMVRRHVLDNDYPLSISEMRDLMSQTGFLAQGRYFSSLHPVGDYFGFIVASFNK